MEKSIGQKIKDLRIAKELTLKDLSEKTNLSISFLSLVERGLTSIAISSLQVVAEALGVEITYFFDPPQSSKRNVVRSYEQEVLHVDNNLIYYSLDGDIEDKVLENLIIVLLPRQSVEDKNLLTHKGEEFVYVLEGIVTVFIDQQEHQLYPGDSYHIKSSVPHNVANFTNKTAKILCISTPSIFK
ncbi:helix-turn-helix domain-containing protein [Desulfitibacter alkalitolerans]|uniref:helix-turn-helix domain-containing protein n=1 Tax=Desulfitibacter alkalitolerans TaxID=264641 RepID=UPI000486F422|nr:XRE family transcriptional regulator [Desulfitibacter alkalitolerans]